MTLSETDQLGNKIGQSLRDAEDLNQSMSHGSGEDTNIIFPTNNIKPIQIVTRTKERLIGTAFILGHTANGILGTSALGAGTLGTFLTSRVVSPNSTFKEFFPNTNFQDTTNSTCDINTTDEETTYDYKKVYQTVHIYKNQTSINSAKPTIFLRSASTTVTIDSSKGGQQVDIYASNT